MEGPTTVLGYICYSIFFLPVFIFLFVVGLYKGIVMLPVVFVIVGLGDVLIMAALLPVHLFWSFYCVLITKKFGPYMKCLLVMILPIPIALAMGVGFAGNLIMGLVIGFGWPFMETFRIVSKEGLPICTRFRRCFTEGYRETYNGACTIVCDFKDLAFYSFFSVVDELLKTKDEEPIELKVTQLPGCLLAACLGILVNVPAVTLITVYKSPIFLFKGWYRLVHDLIGREGPFLETVCVPFAGLWIFLWPLVVILAAIAGSLSSIGFGFYAAAVAYQESSTKKGLLYTVASVSIYDEYTNDLLHLREGSCYPRPRYRERMGSESPLQPVTNLRVQHVIAYSDEPLLRPFSASMKPLQATVIWDSFIKACEDIGKELLREGAIGLVDVDAWKESENKIINIGIPAYALLECFLRSINNDSPGFLLRDNVVITRMNRPEGRVFDWLYDPMSVMKEQIRCLCLAESEELYLFKYCLYSGEATRIAMWENGSVPPQDEIRRAQLEGIGRRIQGFCLTISRLPTSRRRFFEVVKAIEEEAASHSGSHGGSFGDIETGYKQFD